MARGAVIVAAAALLAACGGKSSPAASPPPATTSAPASSSPSVAVSSSASPKHRGRPGMVAVTSGGALEELSPAGAVTKTLVPSGVIGDEVSVSPDGSTVYFATSIGNCTDEVDSVPAAGGTVTQITKGALPAVSPDGSMLAFAREPAVGQHCGPESGSLTSHYKLGIRTLSSGAQRFLPMLPAGQSSGIPLPISHLSWSADHSQLAVSIPAVQDNEGWNLTIVSATSAGYYGGGPGTTSVPVAGLRHGYYYREGVFLPTGSLFVSRACCAGFPVHNKSRLLWEVSDTGAEQHQVAIGYQSLEHVSLAASPDGIWLLYLAGSDLYVSRGGHTPSRVTGGLIAAAWS